MISSTDYKYITDRLGSAQYDGAKISDSLDSLLKLLAETKLDPTNEDQRDYLEGHIYNTYIAAKNRHGAITSHMRNTVSLIQQYIISNHGSIDIFLTDNSIKVSNHFATLSTEVGYPIDSSNVETTTDSDIPTASNFGNPLLNIYYY